MRQTNRSTSMILHLVCLSALPLAACFVRTEEACGSDPGAGSNSSQPSVTVNEDPSRGDPYGSGGRGTGVEDAGGGTSGSAGSSGTAGASGNDVDGGNATSCGSGPIDRDKELFIVDGTVLSSRRAQNSDATANFSFRRVITELTPPGTTPSEFVSGWLESFRTATHVPVLAGDTTIASTVVTPRPRVDEVLVCPWLKLSAENGCDDTCGYCRSRTLDLAKAPFALTAVVNRMDVRDSTRACGADAGEGRLVFTALRPGTREPIPFSLIVEYALPSSTPSDVRAWATRWHALGRIPFGSAFETSLSTLTDRFVRRGARPSAPGGSALVALRTNEAAFSASGFDWELREFRLRRKTPDSNDYALEAVATDNTPRLEFAGTEALGDQMMANVAAIRDRGDNALPAGMVAGAAAIPSATFAWSAPNVVDRSLVAAFNANTCNGCHAMTGGTGVSSFLHVAPADAAGSAALRSPFLLGSGANAGELGRRSRDFAALLCEPCTGAAPYYEARGTYDKSSSRNVLERALATRTHH